MPIDPRCCLLRQLLVYKMTLENEQLFIEGFAREALVEHRFFFGFCRSKSCCSSAAGYSHQTHEFQSPGTLC